MEIVTRAVPVLFVALRPETVTDASTRVPLTVKRLNVIP
jgi:hypothetical protein